jgi:TrpR-related protein YerC/YecD
LAIKNSDEMARFLKDLCTPQELRALAERWTICKMLAPGDLSHRDINRLTGVSLTTIGRVARFLREEPHHGYQLLLERMHDKNIKKE